MKDANLEGLKRPSNKKTVNILKVGGNFEVHDGVPWLKQLDLFHFL